MASRKAKNISCGLLQLPQGYLAAFMGWGGNFYKSPVVSCQWAI